MKKYKLIKKYPGSDPVGTIVIGKGEDGWYSKGPGGKTYDWTHVVHCPEYWEEVIEKDYEILSYIKKGSKTCTTTKRRGGENHEKYWNIHSVKRLSDGEVFTVGDRVKVSEHGSIKTITEIIINNSPLGKEGIWLRYHSGSSHLTHAIKQKQPIFLTHNGKDIFVGDRIVWVNKDSLLHGVFTADFSSLFCSKQHVYFISAVDAQDYIIENKYALSIKEFWEITCMSTSNFNKNTYMKDLVKERLGL
jgi:hypothetical protein